MNALKSVGVAYAYEVKIGEIELRLGMNSPMIELDRMNLMNQNWKDFLISYKLDVKKITLLTLAVMFC